jgi:polyisoprenoid-binding protein YceI
MATTDAQIQSQTATRSVWQLDPHHTLVEFSAKHMMVTTVKGRFTSVRGTIVADEANPSQSSVDVEIDTASIDSRDERRDGHLKSPDFLDVEHYPLITFKSTRVLQEDAEHLRVVGDLTIRGTTRQVELATTINGRGKSPMGSEVAGVSAEASINRKDFGLNWNVALETGGWLVSDTVKVAIEAEAIRQS